MLMISLGFSIQDDALFMGLEFKLNWLTTHI